MHPHLRLDLSRLCIVAVAAFAASACGGGSGSGSETTPPTAIVEQTGPVLGKNEAIVVRFSEAMDPNSLRLTGALGAQGTAVWSQATENNDTVTIAPPGGGWTSGSNQRLVLNARDLAGNPLAELRASFLIKLVFSNFQPAAVVIGQADFAGIADNQGGGADANTLSSPYGSPLVTDDGVLFVGDYGNYRLLGYDSLPTVNNAHADFVLGQPDFVTVNTRPTSRSSIRGPQQVVTVDGKLVVTDYYDNRILIYNSIPTDGSAVPDVVVGQAGFDTGNNDCTAATLGSPETATVTDDGKLVVADSGNSRILIWNSLPTTNGQPADLVLGQGDFLHCIRNDDNQDELADTQPTARTLSGPAGIWTDGTRLVTADSGNNRVLIWTSFPTDNFQPADLVLGQDSFTTYHANDDDRDGVTDATPSARTLNYPYDGVASNGVQLVVTDPNNHRTLIWNSFPTTSFQPADVVLGQSDFAHAVRNDDDQDGNDDGVGSARVQAFPTGAVFHQDKLLVVDGDNNRVLIYQSQ